MERFPTTTEAPTNDGFWAEDENRAWLNEQVPVTTEPELPEEVSQFGFL